MIKSLYNKFLGLFYKLSPYSQAGQDLFALELFGKKGTYIDIGSGEPIRNNNSYLLEVKNNWSGFCLDFNISQKINWEKTPERINKVYWSDATTFDYRNAIIENKLPNNVDFLSCDIDPQEKTFITLKKVFADGLRPKSIAFETDLYREKTDYSSLAESFLKPYGYEIGVKNVYSNLKKNKIFETWFVHKSLNFEPVDYKIWVKKL
jgi:hypothetical protein